VQPSQQRLDRGADRAKQPPAADEVDVLGLVLLGDRQRAAARLELDDLPGRATQRRARGLVVQRVGEVEPERLDLVVEQVAHLVPQ
jgi:hypothetical protein